MAKTSASDAVASVRTISLIADQWHSFVLLHSGGFGSTLTAKLQCPGIPGDLFPMKQCRSFDSASKPRLPALADVARGCELDRRLSTCCSRCRAALLDAA